MSEEGLSSDYSKVISVEPHFPLIKHCRSSEPMPTSHGLGRLCEIRQVSLSAPFSSENAWLRFARDPGDLASEASTRKHGLQISE